MKLAPVWLIANLALASCAVSSPSRSVDRDIESTWGSGVLVFGNRVIDLRLGLSSAPGPAARAVSDCSNSEYFCITGAISVIVPRNCSYLTVGAKFRVGNVEGEVVQEYPSVPPYDKFAGSKFLIRVLYENDRGAAVASHVLYSKTQGIVDIAYSWSDPLRSWRELVDSEAVKFKAPYTLGGKSSFEPVAMCGVDGFGARGARGGDNTGRKG